MDPGLLSNRYQIVRPIGTGDTTRVLEAWDRLAERRVAVKVPIERLANDKVFLLRLEREVAALAGFTHPNIAAVHTVERGGGAGFVVAELVDGASLRDLLASRGPASPTRAAQLAATVCAALAAAHARGIAHGHLTVANVLLTLDGQVKLTDFRLAQAAQPMASAPDPAADLRALGRVLAAMLTGVEPADGEPVRLGPAVPAGLAAIVARADDPERPYSSAAEVGRDVDRFLAAVRPHAAAERRGMPVAPDATDVQTTAVASPAAELVSSSAEPAQLPVARGIALPLTRRRGLAVAVGLVAAGLIVGGVAAVTPPGHQPGGAAVDVGQAKAVAPSTMVRATTTSRPRPATSTSGASGTVTSTVSSRAPTATAPPTGAAPAAPPPATVASRPTATTGQRSVPNVVGLHRKQAADVLAEARLGMQLVPVSIRDPSQVQRVVAQRPLAGEVVPAGSVVTVLVGTIGPTSLEQ
ncbi:MAG TPA: protein kinase [Actinomycetes bacterium]|jgi:serine/threonine-protein kinase|nr:protein kinase [Actinomycetes bacterium]